MSKQPEAVPAGKQCLAEVPVPSNVVGGAYAGNIRNGRNSQYTPYFTDKMGIL